jgi:ankyrin repeat protein
MEQDKGTLLDSILFKRACDTTHCGTTQTLIDNGASINAVDKGGRTPFHNAAQTGLGGTTQTMINKGISINEVDKGSRTPLHNAARPGLIYNGASVKAADEDCHTPLYNAAGSNSCTQTLVHKGTSLTVVGLRGAMEKTIDKGANVSALDKDGRTPLHEAVRADERDAIQILIEKGANIDAIDKDGRTPLHEAAQTDLRDAIQILIEKGASIDVVDKDGRTPLHYAAQTGSWDAIQALIDKDSSIHVVDDNGRTPFQYNSELILKYWDLNAKARADQTFRERENTSCIQDSTPRSLPKVIKDLIWPFYSNWVHLLVGPCTRMVDVQRDEHDTLTSVTIYIVCPKLPDARICELVEKYTQYLIQRAFGQDQGQDQLVIEICQGVSTSSVQTTHIEWSGDYKKLQLGDGIISAIKKNGSVSCGTVGPWLQGSETDVVLFTNEHVIRPGKEQLENHIITYPNREYVGRVVLSSAHHDEAIMDSTHPGARNGNYRFLADWAVIKVQNTVKSPIALTASKDGKCVHVKGIIHIPSRGSAEVLGNESRKGRTKPAKALYRSQFREEGTPTVLSPKSWNGTNERELHCWSLYRHLEDIDEQTWLKSGIGKKGDSGAAVVDCQTRSLCALVVGETRIGKLFRSAVVIDIVDVINDARAKAVQANLPFNNVEAIQCDCAKG